jgi:hypothetical protein
LLHCSLVEHVAPKARDPAAAVTVGIGAPLLVEVAEAAVEAVDDALKPLQKPWLQVLNAHCESSLQTAWKLPQAG